MELHKLTAHELLEKLNNKEITSEQILSDLNKRIEGVNSKVKAYVRSPGIKHPAPNGIPVSIKDNICTEGYNTECCSKILAGFNPPYNATVINKIIESGNSFLGLKCNMDEFAFGSSTENSCFGPTRNPWNPECVTGGSSGGSAAAVAADEAIFALGSDTGGSIRQPAALCGISGLKPTYGVVSRFGMIAFASSLDQAGPMARSAEDLAILPSNCLISPRNIF